MRIGDDYIPSDVIYRIGSLENRGICPPVRRGVIYRIGSLENFQAIAVTIALVIYRIGSLEKI